MTCLTDVSSKKAITVGVVLVALLVLMVVAMCTGGSGGSSLLANHAVASGMQPMVNPDPSQLVAFGQNELTLPMGVTLVGKGYVEVLVPGSPAARAGLQVGDIINRINGR